MNYLILNLLLFLLKLNQVYSIPVDVNFPLNAYSLIYGEIKSTDTNETHKIHGYIEFYQKDELSTLISVNIDGLPEINDNKIVKKGFHIHELQIPREFNGTNNITEICGSAGAHYNPTNESHGLSSSFKRHNGDLGNLLVYKNGKISINIIDKRVKLFGNHSVINRTIILHENEDDGGFANNTSSHMNGNSGSRIACGLIIEGNLENKSDYI